MPDHNVASLSPAPPADPRPAVARSRRRGRRLLLAAVVAAALGLGGAAFLSIRGPAVFGRAPAPPAATVAVPGAEPPPALTVSAAAAAERPMARVVVGDGSVVAWQELVVGAEAGGLRVVEVA